VTGNQSVHSGVRDPKPVSLAHSTVSPSTDREAFASRNSGNTRVQNVSSFGKFWAQNCDLAAEDEEEELPMPMKEELIEAAEQAGFSIQDLIQAENELEGMEKVCFSSPSVDLRCPLSSKIVKAIIREKSLKHKGRPWQGSLPKPRISLPKTLGDAVIKNSYVRLLGGQLVPKSFKMALPSTIHGGNVGTMPNSQADQREEWLPLPNFVQLKGRTAKLAPDTVHVQNSNSEGGFHGSGRVLIVNGKRQAWFHPSKDLNVLFSRAGPKPRGFKASLTDRPNPKRSFTPQLSNQRRRTYVEELKIEGAGGGRGFGAGRREEDDRERQREFGNQAAGGNSVSAGDRRPSSPGRAQLRYNPGHDRGSSLRRLCSGMAMATASRL
jgi:hypothetical protein